MNQNNTSLIKTVVVGSIGTAVSYFVTAWIKELLEEKPLKTRVREGKQKAVDIKDKAMSKAQDVKSATRAKADELAVKTRMKTRSLVEEKKDEVDALIEEPKTDFRDMK